jgi:CheY-like chemotaxis protein
MPYVLMVDDEPDSCEFVTRFLTQHGFRTHCANNGREALSQLLLKAPDAVVLDVRMPEMDGISLLDVLRSYLRWSDLPVILLTAHATQHDLDRAEQLGVSQVFRKANFKLVELLESLRRVIPPAAKKNGA